MSVGDWINLGMFTTTVLSLLSGFVYFKKNKKINFIKDLENKRDELFENKFEEDNVKVKKLYNFQMFFRDLLRVKNIKIYSKCSSCENTIDKKELGLDFKREIFKNKDNFEAALLTVEALLIYVFNIDFTEKDIKIWCFDCYKTFKNKVKDNEKTEPEEAKNKKEAKKTKK